MLRAHGRAGAAFLTQSFLDAVLTDAVLPDGVLPDEVLLAQAVIYNVPPPSAAREYGHREQENRRDRHWRRHL